MLPKPPDDVSIHTRARTYPIEGDSPRERGVLYAATLRGPGFSTRANSPRQALFLHPEGLGVNQTLIDRPARWLLAKDVFDVILLPDRRGSGRSSHLHRPQTPAQNAADLRRLLDRMAQEGDFDPNAGLTVIGVSYGGLLALSLAATDPRVRCVALVAASPQMRRPGLLMRFLLRTGLLGKLLDGQLRRSLGKRPSADVDFDPAYDAADPSGMSAHFNDAVYSLPPDRADSLRYAYQATHDPLTARLPPSLSLDLPILQVTGEGDELWETHLPPEAARRFPNLRRVVVPGALIHNDVYLQAEAFYNTLAEELKTICPGSA